MMFGSRKIEFGSKVRVVGAPDAYRHLLNQCFILENRSTSDAPGVFAWITIGGGPRVAIKSEDLASWNIFQIYEKGEEPPYSEDAFAADLDLVLAGVRGMLLQKNQAYGDSALDPVRIFSKASPLEQLLVRVDDKLSRLKRGSDAGEDVLADLLGYLVLIRIARLRAERK